MEMVLVLAVLCSTVGAIIAVALFLYHFYCMLQGIQASAQWWVSLVPWLGPALPGALNAQGQTHRAKAVGWGALGGLLVLIATVARCIVENGTT
jgi:hypothetical protein